MPSGRKPGYSKLSMQVPKQNVQTRWKNKIIKWSIIKVNVQSNLQ